MRNPRVMVSVSNRTRLDSTREINEKLIVLGDESAARMKGEKSLILSMLVLIICIEITTEIGIIL